MNKTTQVLNNLTPYKTIRMENLSNEQLDGELAEKISNRGKLFKKFKRSKLHIDELIYKEKKNKQKKFLKKQEEKFFQRAWKNLNKCDLLQTKTPSSNICLIENNGLPLGSLSIAKNFK